MNNATSRSVEPRPGLGRRRLTVGRRRIALMLLGAAGFVALGPLLWVAGAMLFAVVDVAFFGLCAVFAVWQLFRPPWVELDERGITVYRPPSAPRFDTWDGIGPATVWHSNRQRLVTFDSRTFDRTSGRQAKLNRSLGARGNALHPGHAGLPAEELAALINAYREAYGASAAE